MKLEDDMQKPKVAFYWCASCGGCEEAVVDLAEDVLTVVEAVDIVLWPVALDFKKSDVEALDDGEITVSLINGGVRNAEQMEMVELLRKKSKLVVAFGSCAHLGGIPGLANLYGREDILKLCYEDVPTVVNPDKVYPMLETETENGTLKLPEFYSSVKALHQAIDVDYYLPGCAPPPNLILEAVKAILEGKLPKKGAVLAPNKTLCDTCPRRDSKPEKLLIKEVVRPALTEMDDEKCFLAQGMICTGPATRSGCGERCINANMPCRGCFGPPSTVTDQGGKFLSALTSCVDSEDETEAKEILDQIIDPTGLFYMYSLPSSVGVRFKDGGSDEK